MAVASAIGHSVTSSGYRDPEALRFRDESQAVQRKVNARKAPKTIPRSLLVSISSQRKDIFYYNCVVGTTKLFGFLQAFYSPTSKDEHLSRSVDAVALAGFKYQRWRRRGSNLAKKDSTILTILLLDLYEKINKEPKFEGAWAAHLSGALALVKLRGTSSSKTPAPSIS